jgi:4-hydroxybenzoate polyprenyltransferase
MRARAIRYARLVRLPNVFTALADIALGAAVIGFEFAGTSTLILALASACLYCSGMVWNDVFDVEQDARERPFRPIPSGQIPVRSAVALAAILIIMGTGLAFCAGWPSGALAAGLSAAILLYDRWLKRTAFGPVGMGACRFLNVLLGLSIADASTVNLGLRVHLASVVGIYVGGVTWFAAREAAKSRREALRGAAIVIGASLALALAAPLHFESGTASIVFPYALAGLAMVVGTPIWRAIEQPEPAYVQVAVKTAILGIIGLDAVLATAISGIGGLWILVLLIPAIVLGRWLYST